ncbi:MAG: hypothetical protein M0C28_32810 [Candidatus Moduliflexus flocculans]|nr:hypothetical protein [Candidatus Moduliflexus flocculans]
MHCHTSSGRYRFKKEKFNDACMPCHEDKVKNPTAHTHHPAASEGSKCISCHMPMTAFARMNRSDHSMLPPTPAATMAYKSPNACNLCHTGQGRGMGRHSTCGSGAPGTTRRRCSNARR